MAKTGGGAMTNMPPPRHRRACHVPVNVHATSGCLQAVEVCNSWPVAVVKREGDDWFSVSEGRRARLGSEKGRSTGRFFA